jgi:hypothetical protein
MCLQEFAGMIFFAGGQRLRVSPGPVPSLLISSIYSFSPGETVWNNTCCLLNASSVPIHLDPNRSNTA